MNSYDLLRYYFLTDFEKMASALRMGTAGGVFVMFAYMVIQKLRGEKPTLRQMGGIFLLTVYAALVMDVAFFSREPGSRTTIDLTLFSTWRTSLRDHLYVVENVIMFLPLGILIPTIWKKRGRLVDMALLSCGFSLVIELMQLMTERGYCQLDDVVMNTLGGILGFGIYKIVEMLDAYISKKWA